MPDQIEVVRPDNSTIPLFQMEPVRSVERAEQVQDLLGQDVVNMTVLTAEPLELLIGQRIAVFGKTYHLNQMPTAKKLSERKFEYDLTFEGPQYLLRRAVFFNTDGSGFNTTSDFPLTGNAEFFLDVLINNLVRVFGAGKWVKGEFPTTPVKTISFQEMSCRDAIQTICKEFETEFDIVQGSGFHTLHIRKAGQILGHTYQYGRGLGLYNLKRQTVNPEDIVTRLYPFGASKNLPSNYRNFSQRLKIADPGYIEDASAIAAFGILERTHAWDDIYPRRTGTVTSVSGGTSFVDASMNFDLFEKTGSGTTYLTDGNSAKVHFNTGNLAGYEFEVLKYTHATKTFVLSPMTDERGLELPSGEHLAFQIQPGDEYVLLDIVLPATYIETAEAELLFKAQQFLDQNKAPKVQYELTFDEMYFQALAGDGSVVNYFDIGDYVHVLDDDLLVDKSTRVIGLKRDVLHPYRYTLTLDDTYQVSFINQVIESQKDVQKIIKINDLRDPNRARMGWKTTLELLGMIFDTDGYFDGGKIKPESIETMMLVVGAKSQQFILQDVVFQPNFEGNANVVAVSAGLLIHYALKEEILTWNIEASTHTIPDSAARYIYAKVHKTNFTEGHIIFSTDQILPDEDPTYYHFLVGTLHSVMEGVRWISLTYGATAINGRFIKTGRIQSFDGLTYFDLDLGAIGGYIKFIDSQGNYRDLSDIGAATDRFYELTITEPLDSYIAGFVTAWFQATNPATWPGGEEAYHEGDHWYNPNTDTVMKRVGGAWVPIVDAATLASYRKQYTIRGNNSKIQLFTAQPVAPYADGDLWMSPDGLRRSLRTKVTGMPFDPNDWVEPFNFDNTATAIDGHIVTSGIIQLAGDKNAIWAGMSGQGTDDDSVRFWAGASTVNRDTAPLRIFQGGWLVARSRIEVEGWNPLTEEYEGQAGLAGWAGPGAEDDGIRGWAGTTYENRANAPFQYHADGSMYARKGQIGNIRIYDNQLTNEMELPEGGTSLIGTAGIKFTNESKSDKVIIGSNSEHILAAQLYPELISAQKALPRVGADNIAAVFSASGATASGLGIGGENVAILAETGKTVVSELNVNGCATLTLTIANGQTPMIDPTRYSFIVANYANGANVGIEFMTAGLKYALKAGAEVDIMSNNDNTNLNIRNTIQGDPGANIPGGANITLKWTGSFWRIKAKYDNDW